MKSLPAKRQKCWSQNGYGHGELNCSSIFWVHSIGDVGSSGGDGGQLSPKKCPIGSSASVNSFAGGVGNFDSPLPLIAGFFGGGGGNGVSVLAAARFRPRFFSSSVGGAGGCCSLEPLEIWAASLELWAAAFFFGRVVPKTSVASAGGCTASEPLELWAASLELWAA